MHEHKPIQKDHEMICASCGIVLASIIDLPELPDITNLININNYATQTTIHQKWNTDKTNYYNSQVLKVYNRLQKILEEEGLPLSFANHALKIIIMRNKGLWSFKWQVTTLIQTLESKNDIRLKDNIKRLRSKYNNAKGT